MILELDLYGNLNWALRIYILKYHWKIK